MNNLQLSSSLRSAVSTLHKRLRKQMYSAETHSMTEIATMGFLYQAKVLFPTEIALMAKIRVQSMSQLLKKLEKQKLIKRTPSKEDRRKTYISLTDKGKHKVEITRYERDEWLANAIKKSLSENEKQTIIDAIKILNKLAEIK